MTLPLDVWVERRRDIRFSIARKSINLRVPYGISQKQLNEQIELTKQWVSGVFQKKPELKERFVVKTYQTGDTIQLKDITYTLFIKLTDKKGHHAQLKENQIHLHLTSQDSPDNRHKAAKKLISRLISKHALPEFAKRVDTLNDQFFQEEINNIRIKYNHSNWGSCSSKRNLNFSSRLLFAPDDVVDYVIIHELAHLKEANHSPRFWAIVANVMPNYKEKERWLKIHGKQLDF